MAARTPLQQARDAFALTVRQYGRTSPEAARARAQLQFLKTLSDIYAREARLAAQLEAAEEAGRLGMPENPASSDPPMTPEQRDQVIAALHPERWGKRPAKRGRKPRPPADDASQP